MQVHPDAIGRKRTQIVRLLLEAPGYAELRDGIVTDFKSTLVSRQTLNSGEISLPYRAENEDEPAPNAQVYRIRVEPTGSLTVSELTDYLTSTSATTVDGNNMPIVQAFNIILGHYAKASSSVATIGSRKAFAFTADPQTWDLGAGLTAIRGFFSSVRVAASRILVNVNVSNGAFFDSVPLDQLIRRYGEAHKSNVHKLNSFLKKLRVRQTHMQPIKNRAGQTIVRAKTISGLATSDDGYGTEHPPRVKSFGAGAKDVEFFKGESTGPPSTSASESAAKSASKKKGKKPNEPSQSGPSTQGKYVSVYDYFRTGMALL